MADLKDHLSKDAKKVGGQVNSKITSANSSSDTKMDKPDQKNEGRNPFMNETGCPEFQNHLRIHG